MRVGVVNRFDGTASLTYPLGRALERLGATYVPVDVRTIRAHIADGITSLALIGDSSEGDRPFENLDLTGVVWRVSENSFNDYRNLLELIALRHPVINNVWCLQQCSDKWRTASELVAAGIPVVPTTLMLPGMDVPGFLNRQTLIKPCTGAGGRGVRVVEAGLTVDLLEPHVAQPFVRVPSERHVRVIVCGAEPVAAMHRRPNSRTSANGIAINNIEAGGSPAPAALAPVRDLAAAAARCLGGAILAVDLVPWGDVDDEFAVLEVNACPGLTGIAQVSEVDVYRSAAESALDRLRQP